MQLTFEWDEEKANTNIRKHHVSFDEARTVFGDPTSITITDPEHSSTEDRFITIGMSARQTLLAVVYSERGINIRIISSRSATKAERTIYEEGI